jgi:DNA polymerase I-like protein with 3'-5' exonuclease and polymerase domains
MYKLIRDWEDFVNPFDKSLTMFCDTETYEQQGETTGGLYGNVRLFQAYQEGMDHAVLFDCMFLGLDSVLNIVQQYKQVYHNASYDLHTINCHTEKLWLPEDIDDTLYLSRIHLFKKGPKFDFYTCLKHINQFDDRLAGIDKKENQEADWGGPLSVKMLEYAAYDVLFLSILYDEVKEASSTEVYLLDKFNLKFAIEYARRGIPINRQTVKKKRQEVMAEMERLGELLTVNPNSSKQVCALLGTPSSDKDTLVHMSLLGNKDAENIKNARAASKTLMFLKKYDRPVIKGFFNPCGTISGRMSCTGGDRYSHENLQQIPRRILDVLHAPEGYVIVYKDYAGLELRMACCWIGEPTMSEMIFKGVDLHTYTGCILYNVTPEIITKTQRMIGKICNFLLIYGGGVGQLQATIRAWGGLLEGLATCKKISQKWFEAYPYFSEWHNMHKNHFRVYGYLDITTALGRPVRTFTVPDSLNVPIQGSSSEVTKTSLKYLKERYPDENLINTIHDSNALLVREDQAGKWVERLNECMVEAWYYVIKDLAIPDLPMPPEAEYKVNWSF